MDNDNKMDGVAGASSISRHSLRRRDDGAGCDDLENGATSGSTAPRRTGSSASSASSSSSANLRLGDVRVLYDYEYEKKDGTSVSILAGQLYSLVDRTNDVWWRVKPNERTLLAPGMKFGKAFYVPANYVEEIVAENSVSRSSSRASRNDSTKRSSDGMAAAVEAAATRRRDEDDGRDDDGDRNVDCSSKKSVAEKRKSFELMTASTPAPSAHGGGSFRVTREGSLKSREGSLKAKQESLKGREGSLKSRGPPPATPTRPVAVPRKSEVDSEDEPHHPLPLSTYSPSSSPSSRERDPSSATNGVPLSSADPRPSSTSFKPSSLKSTSPLSAQSASYDSGIDNPCYGRLDEVRAAAAKIGGSGESLEPAPDRATDGSSEEALGPDRRASSADELRGIEVVDIVAPTVDANEHRPAVKLSSFATPAVNESLVASFAVSLEQSKSRHASVDEVFDASAAAASSKRTFVSKAATLPVVLPPRVPTPNILEDDAATTTTRAETSTSKSLERDPGLPRKMEAFGGKSGITRERPASYFNYLSKDIDVGLEKNKLRKTSSRELLFESDAASDENYVRRTVEETRKSLEDLTGAASGAASAAATAASSSSTPSTPDWKTKSYDDLLRQKQQQQEQQRHRRRSKREGEKSSPSSSSFRREAPLPPGWTKEFDSKAERDVFLFRHEETVHRWMCERDASGRPYYFSADGSVSRWRLPSNPSAEDESRSADKSADVGSEDERSHGSSCSLDNDLGADVSLCSSGDGVDDNRRRRRDSSGDNVSRDEVSPLEHLKPEVLKKGWLNYTKYQYGQKRLNKNWTKAFVLLIGNWLTFYSSEKKTKAQKNHPFGKPEFRVDLNGGSIDDGAEKTKKKNVILITAFTPGSEIQLLLQSDQAAVIEDWKADLQTTVTVCQEEQDSLGRLAPRSPSSLTPSPSGQKSFLGGSEDSLASAETPTSRRSFFSRSWLENWFRRRPSFDVVKEKGLIKSRLVFGASIEELAEREKNSVPSFVSRCIAALERRGALGVDGVFRINGNNAEIHKLRFLVDEGDAAYDLLDPKWDVHTLTGSLKLFFRELQKPLIPWEVFESALEVLRRQGDSDRKKSKALKSIFEKSMPSASRATLVALCRHLDKVVALKSENRMQASNLAICFGPTLIWPPDTGGSAGGGGGASIAINMMYQSQIVEFLLLNCDQVFGKE